MCFYVPTGAKNHFNKHHHASIIYKREKIRRLAKGILKDKRKIILYKKMYMYVKKNSIQTRRPTHTKQLYNKQNNTNVVIVKIYINTKKMGQKYIKQYVFLYTCWR